MNSITTAEVAILAFIMSFLAWSFIRSRKPKSKKQLQRLKKIDQRRKERYYNIGVNARKKLLTRIKGGKNE